MKKVGLCDNCKRSVYTNELNLCKRCHQESWARYAEKQDSEEIENKGRDKHSMVFE